MNASPPDDPEHPARDAAVAWLMGRINYELTGALPHSAAELKLDRVRELLRRMGDPQRGLRIVHIAGTKGKGSVGAMIAAALEAAGHTAGVYSSPHLDRIEERFAVGGEACTADEFAELVAGVRPLAEAMDSETGGGRGPTFFDLTTAIALRHFERRGVDAVVLEVGLGGRLDSTNVVTPDASVITSISLDHTRQLGPTRDLIAAEKAGILKPGVPAVSGVADAEAGDVIEAIATERGCPLWRRGRDFNIEPDGDGWRFWRLLPEGAGREVIDDVRPSLPGRPQAENAAVALATLGVLADAGWALPVDARRHGVATGRLPGRLERFEGRPSIIIDGAHNDASAEALGEALDQLCRGAPRERRVLVVGASADKDLGAILKPLARRFAAVVATRYVENPRALDPEQVAAMLGELIDPAAVTTAPSPREALTQAMRLSGPRGAVVVAGSLLLAAEARRIVLKESRGAEPWVDSGPAPPP